MHNFPYIPETLRLGKGPSLNDVSAEGEGGGPSSKSIYYISLFSNLSQQGEGGGVISSGKWADVVYGWPLNENTNLSNGNINLSVSR